MMLRTQPRLAGVGSTYEVDRIFSVPHGDVFLRFWTPGADAPTGMMECNYDHEAHVAIALGTVASLAGICDGEVFVRAINELGEKDRSRYASVVASSKTWIEQRPRINYFYHIATNFQTESIIYYELGNDYFEHHCSPDLDDDTDVTLLNVDMVFPMVDQLTRTCDTLPSEWYFEDSRFVLAAMQDSRLLL